MVYTQVQCIGYKVPTVAKVLNQRTLKVIWKIPSTNAQGLDVNAKLRDPNDERSQGYLLRDTQSLKTLQLPNNTDAFNRVKRFLNVLWKARKSLFTSHRDNILKVFMAPEFYFRPFNPHVGQPPYGYRAYDYETYRAIKNVLRDAISQMTPSLKNWLVIPGTIMWYAPKGSNPRKLIPNPNQLPPPPRKRGKMAADTYFNSCVYIHCNETNMTSHVLEKAWPSDKDGIPIHWLDDITNTKIPGSGPELVKDHARGVTLYNSNRKKEKHLFDCINLRIGLEICLEHSFTRMDIKCKGLLKETLTRLGRGSDLHLQLLTAGGMDTNFDSIMTQNKGVFFRNDGSSSNPLECMFDDRNQMTYLRQLKVIPLKNCSNSYLNPPPMPDPNEILNTKLSFEEQKIVIYCPQKI